MKPEYSLRFKSLTEKNAIIHSLLNEGYIVGSSKVGSEYVVDIYGQKSTVSTASEDSLAKIKKKIDGIIGGEVTGTGSKPFPYPPYDSTPKKNPYQKPYDPFGGPTIFFYGSGQDLLGSLEKDFDIDGDILK